MKSWKRPLFVLVLLLAAGALRMPAEQALHKTLRSQGLLPPALNIGTREKIGQTSSAVALGGLRTLVATFLNLRAFNFFAENRWSDLAETYEIIVDLAPHTRYYWESGYWHLAYNAASYYLNRSELPTLRRREAWRASILHGRAFLERGIRNNPDDWALHARLGQLLSDPNKLPAYGDDAASFQAAAEAYDRAGRSPEALGYVRRFHLYTLARVPGREAEALAIARSLYEESQRNRTPTLLCVLYVLEAPHQDPLGRAIELFQDAKTAYDWLGTYWQRSSERLPVHGVADALARLEQHLEIPPDQRVLSQPLPPPPDIDDWFNRSR